MENKEKYIISQINNHREAVDTDELWANISGVIPQQEEKKKRGFIWFWGGFLVLIIASLSGYMLGENSINTGELKESPTEKSTLKEMGQPIAELSIIEKDKSENETLKIEINSNTEHEKENSNSTSLIDLRKNEKLEGNRINRGARSTSNELTQSEKTLLDNNKNLTAQIFKRDFLEGEVTLDHVELKYNALGPISVEERVDNRIVKVSNLSQLELRLLDFQRNAQEIKKKDFVKVDLNIENSNKVARWATFINTGISNVTRQLSTSDIEFLDQGNRRNFTEEVIGGWDVTVGLTYQINPSIGISSGISVGQIHERATYTTSYQLESEEESVTALIHTQDGTINALSGNATKYTNRRTNEVRNNTFRYFSIPVIIKYRLLENETYSLNLNGNIAYTFSQTYNGFISLDENEPAYELTSDVQNNFTRSGGLSFGFGLEAGRRISQNWDMNIGVGMRYLQGISSNTNPIKQEYKLYNLTFGISRKI